jgi:NAD(P)-dependent dehydrogenase (short-subunit alcohol dehydrogenase family)
MSTVKPVALITGGAKGIGHAIARHLIASGWQVSIIDLPDSGLRRAFARERDVFAIEGDVRNEETASDAVDATVHRFHRLDGLISNAGIMIRKPLRRLTLSEWHRVLDTRRTTSSIRPAASAGRRMSPSL